MINLKFDEVLYVHTQDAPGSDNATMVRTQLAQLKEKADVCSFKVSPQASSVLSVITSFFFLYEAQLPSQNLA